MLLLQLYVFFPARVHKHKFFLRFLFFFFFLILVFNPSLFYSDSLVSYYINNEEDVLMPECFCWL